jgi:cell filamentation protein
MYEVADDPYCYPGTTVLINLLGIRDPAELAEFEISITTQRGDEPLPVGQLQYSDYCAIHHHLFQDVYEWAGEVRQVRIAKQGSMFCYPEHIDREMRRVFQELSGANHFRGLVAREFAARAAHFVAELNAIHPFREGNGRTQLAFLTALAREAGHPFDFGRLNPPAVLQAMIDSFSGDEAPLATLILGLIEPN